MKLTKQQVAIYELSVKSFKDFYELKFYGKDEYEKKKFWGID